MVVSAAHFIYAAVRLEQQLLNTLVKQITIARANGQQTLKGYKDYSTGVFLKAVSQTKAPQNQKNLNAMNCI